ncbi:transcriptional corepressor LEUNIG isoform X1 [Cryptomeria japonica]|uniref:transcriptional corepressor LEUNIG isoform X1 n=2 Tax=Cryptomeria japonica TaxID=3369 RepID=UPI0027DA52FC|nr:transcriptional corepressor LEUNIG isoform X1 [Cryptomeria japonica]XP_057831764.2 transcriptional corepressor LEUNIG isoform X1 [Cryptomeria japonica]XP_057831765.2 transcriptional corepressor LEUNIG isoform X1 [Cryptomeria japonica]XP_057831766.2 transcriptional corepressor LEUNIG isoform X1 [Cryptomeria japonica]
MGQAKWEADKMLDVYIHDYLVKRGLSMSAKTFMSEGKVCTEPVAIDAPGGFLFEWWSVFWDIFISRTNEKHSEKAASYIEIQQAKARELQIQHEKQERQWQQQQQQNPQQEQQIFAQLRRNMTHPSINGAANSINPENRMGQSTVNAMTTKIYEQCLKQSHQRDGFEESALKRVGESPAHFLDCGNAVLNKAASIAGQPSGSLFQNTAANVSGPAQQGQVWRQPIPGNSQGSLVIDPSMLGVSGPVLKCDLPNHGANNGIPLKGWPLNSMEQLSSSLQQQRQNQFYQQFKLMSPQQQQEFLLQAKAHNLGDADLLRLKLSRSHGLTGMDSLPIENDGSHGMGRQMQMSSMARAASQDQADLVSKIKMVHMMQQQQPLLLSQRNLQQQQQQQLQQQQQHQESHQQFGKKRKHASSSGAANSTGTGNTPGPSANSVPSTPSAHTPGDMMSMASTLQQSNSASKNLMMHGSDGTGGLASPSNQMVDMHFEDCALDENIESYFLPDEGEKREGVSDTMKNQMTSSKGFSFKEVGNLLPSTNKVVCCHFSPDGKWLASAGHDKKAVLWNVETMKLKSTFTEHTHFITDVRFSPNPNCLASASFDKTVKVWEADKTTYSLRSFTGHSASVNSVDFHPSNGDLLCSCDEDSEIRYWSISQGACTKVSKGGSTQLRFQPQVGQYLAAATENAVTVFDVETDTRLYSLQKHNRPVRSLCWNATGQYVASVSEDCVKISSVADGGRCIQQIPCTGNPFQTCIFHPTYPGLVVIGCYQTIELWNTELERRMTVKDAHEGLIAALSSSATTGMIASASHDKYVKLWK